MTFTTDAADRAISDSWEQELIPQLRDYIAIPALSPAFDADWEANGHLEKATSLVEDWMRARPIVGMTVERQTLPGRTPMIVAEIPAFGQPESADAGDRSLGNTATTVLYGHLDKQPEMTGWREGLGPWIPVLDGTRLYGRGGADDGYAAFASLTAIEAVQANGGAHPRLLVLIEASEESGSPDLPAHLTALGDRLGDVELVVCLDSGCATYDTLWLTTSLRGLAAATVTVDILTEGVHSGSASGIVPSSFRILRQLLDRIEDPATGELLLASAKVEIPEYRRAEAVAVADMLGPAALENMPFVPGARPMVDSVVDGLLGRTWKPTVSYIGVDGVPASKNAGNVLRPGTSLTLSLRLPPPVDSASVIEELRTVLETDPPYGAKITVGNVEAADGWSAPDLAPWLAEAINDAAMDVFGEQMQLYGEGGSIPFMGMLGERFPQAQFVITGVLGPASNAHGPNEFLDVAYAEKLTGCLARVLDRAGRREP